MTDYPHVAGRSRSTPRSISEPAFGYISQMLQKRTGIQLPPEKRGLAVSRLSQRLRRLSISDFDEYCDLLRSNDNDAEFDELVALLTTNVTRFFRERHHFDELRQAILPPLVKNARNGGSIRIWSAGCSTGEEAYSMAFSVLSVCPEANSLDIKILATDIDKNVLHSAQAGIYEIEENEFGSNPLLKDNTNPTLDGSDRFVVSDAARKLVQFGHLNLIDSWPMINSFDIILCRNVLIYFSSVTQEALFLRFADQLSENGKLFIGHSERVSGAALTKLKSSGVTQYTKLVCGARK